jgi:hypothetical protein
MDTNIDNAPEMVNDYRANTIGRRLAGEDRRAKTGAQRLAAQAGGRSLTGED